MDNITGKLYLMNTLSGTLSEVQELTGQIDISTTTKNLPIISGNLTVPVRVDAKYYDGGYVVTPKAYEEQPLNTKGKTLIDNILVEEIPYYEVSNLEGGSTVYIG